MIAKFTTLEAVVMGMILLWFAKFPPGIPRQYGDLNLLAQGSCGLEWPTLGARRRFGNRSAGGADCLISPGLLDINGTVSPIHLRMLPGRDP